MGQKLNFFCDDRERGNGVSGIFRQSCFDDDYNFNIWVEWSKGSDMGTDDIFALLYLLKLNPSQINLQVCFLTSL